MAQKDPAKASRIAQEIPILFFREAVDAFCAIAEALVNNQSIEAIQVLQEMLRYVKENEKIPWIRILYLSQIARIIAKEQVSNQKQSSLK